MCHSRRFSHCVSVCLLTACHLLEFIIYLLAPFMGCQSEAGHRQNRLRSTLPLNWNLATMSARANSCYFNDKQTNSVLLNYVNIKQCHFTYQRAFSFGALWRPKQTESIQASFFFSFFAFFFDKQIQYSKNNRWVRGVEFMIKKSLLTLHAL